MHSLMSRVLDLRQLNSAGQLFAVNDYDVITDLHHAFVRIKEIFNGSSYCENRVDQSVVEICIARITAAIRETGSMDTYAAELVDLLASCLRHKMREVDEQGNYVDSPHCKIANDLLSSLFLHYSKRSVMTLTLPVAIKALGCSNQDLVKNTTSYISLAAIHNGKALSHHAIQIISHIINGNYSLLRVLPQIYSDNREPFHAHLGPLLAVLGRTEADCSEKISVLQLASMVANQKPDLLTPYLLQFDSFLLSDSTCTAVLNIYMSLVSQGRAHALAPYMRTMKQVALRRGSSNVAPVCKIIGNIGRVSQQMAVEAVEELIRCAQLNDSLLQSILNEIEAVVSLHPSALRPHVDSIRHLSTPETTRIVDRIINLAGVSSRASNSVSTSAFSALRTEQNSCDSLLSKPDAHIITSGSRTVVAVGDSAAELDRNTHSLAMQYQNRSSGSLSRVHSRSHASIAGGRSASDAAGGSRDVSSIASDHRSRTLEPTHIQMGVNGRVRPVGGARRPVQWSQGCETTFPAHSGPVTTKMRPLREEDETQWTGTVDRSDVVLQFVEHRKNKIRRYISEVSARFPIPIQCTVEGSKSSKHRMLVHFGCQLRGSHCVFNDDYLFAFKTKMAAFWLHLMFLQMESTSLDASGRVACQSSQGFLTLANCWQCLPQKITKGQPFVTLVTSAFPTAKDQDQLLKELETASFFDCFTLEPESTRWTCFSCAQPDKVRCLSDGASKMLEGQLKEKRGRWRFMSRWHTKYFTLSSAALTATKQNEPSTLLPGIDLKSIRSVRSLSRGKKNRKSLRKAFEIFTADNTSVVLKATDEKKAEEWLQCIQIAVAHAKREP